MGIETDIAAFCDELHNLLNKFRHIPAHQVAARLNDKAAVLQTGSPSTLNADQADANANKPLADQAAENAAQPNNPAAEGLDAKTLPVQDQQG